MTSSERRLGDAIQIPGNYQFQAAFAGSAPQRFWHQTRFEVCLDMLDAGAGMRVLDVGCGSGVFADMVAAVDGTEVTAVDGNREAVSFAERQFCRSNLSFVHGLVDELAFESSSFDRISCLEVIEHIHPEQGRAVMRTFHRLLAPGGRLVISTPNMHSYWPALEWSLDRLRLVPTMDGEQHVAGYHPRALRALGEETGFRLRSTRTLFVLSPWLALANWRLAKALHRLEEAIPVHFGTLLVQSFDRA
ncbi:MAG: methyltransferase domain-containing protein [Deltaproteobacteria bacterium]|nr:methyltransferase domain-containing protein [Deltaproteobacteria bacterium]NND29818.1 methyltransferase domain-containing protein [Myxococcales bacterium]MBT8465426.1 methyltransferase domain-containing protein [Deltaproteobacteria bacterium]MBT8483057.1 methyltransferase domain-containing protein [Deltaproteobacteria bacterium]NNK09510.1 methyltransferase domain-containing protein [Myxococcales bacterium]